jgi:Lrp/AsnC family leucine-responsive transcriptional regulator
MFLVGVLTPRFKEDSTMTETLDKTDLQMLRVLQADARITVKDLALKVHLSPTPVFERLHRLENEGIIKRYTAVVDAAKLGRGFLVFCSVRLRRMGKDIAHDFVNRVKDIPEVAECYNISGDFDYLLKIYAPDMQYYNDFLINTLGTIESLGSVQSSFVMSEIKSSYGLPL